MSSKGEFLKLFCLFWNSKPIIEFNFCIKSVFFNTLVLNQLIMTDSSQKDFTNIVTYTYLTSLKPLTFV